MPTFTYCFDVRAPLDVVWRFHDDPHMLPRVMRGPVQVRVVHVDQPMQPGSRISLVMQVGPARRRWNLRLRERQPPTRFTDEQIPGQGPFAVWSHTHTFQALDDTRSRICDTVTYELPFGAPGRWAGHLFGNVVMRWMFASRERATRRVLESGEMVEAR